MKQQPNGASGNPAGVAAAWAVVLIPLIWGVYMTFLNVEKLFK